MRRTITAGSVLLLAMVALSAPTGALETNDESRPNRNLLDLLSTWTGAAPDVDSVPDRLVDIVKRDIRDGSPQSRELLFRAAAELARSDPQIYVPVIALCTIAHRRAVERQLFSAAHELRAVATTLISRFVQESTTDEARELGARFYFSLAGPLRETTGLDLAITLLSEALELDPVDPDLLYAAAAIQEKYGEYNEAVQLLSRLLEVRPEPAAGLRLALCHLRLGREDQAERRLADLSQSEARPWVRAIAFQELSKIHQRAGDHAAALSLARDGRKLFPHDESLAVLVAYLTPPGDPAGDRLIQQLTSESAVAEPTARGIYNSWPPGLAGNEERIDTAVAAAAPRLAAALADGRTARGEQGDDER